MKTILAALSFIVSALTVSGQTEAELNPASEVVSVGAFSHDGRTWQNTRARMTGSNAVYVSGDINNGDPKSTTLTWRQVPISVQWKLEKCRALWLDIEKREAAALAQGREWAGGNIIGRTPKGFLLSRAGQAVHILAPMPGVDGDKWGGYVKYNGIYKYRTAAGAAATVREYVLWGSAQVPAAPAPAAKLAPAVELVLAVVGNADNAYAAFTPEGKAVFVELAPGVAMPENGTTVKVRVRPTGRKTTIDFPSGAKEAEGYQLAP